MSQKVGVQEALHRLPVTDEGFAEDRAGRAGLGLGPARPIRPPAKPAGRAE